MRRFLAVVLLAGGAFGPSTWAASREQCRAPAPAASREPNIFSPAQENDLGDAVAERFESSLRIVDDEPLTANLRRIGERLVAHLPANELKIRFFLVDIPDANAFVLPGGRIYVSRKLIGLTRSEDELAGVLGHELGHLVARQVTIAATRQLKEVLNVTTLGDRADVIAKYNRLMDNAGRKPGVFRASGHDGADQIEADRLGFFIVAAAGYDANAHVAFFDRFAETEGDTGGFFSRMFGTTNPDARRLGELVKNASALPAGCAAAPPAAGADAYRQWQIAVAGAPTTSQTESLPGLVRQTPLAPLRDQIQHLRFSPDGKYLLAQDDSSISVLDREPLALRFRIATESAKPAEFTPDSSGVVLHRSDLRVERWSVADRKLADVNDLYWKNGCIDSALAPDGKTVACVDSAGHLTLIDVASGRQVFQRKSFYRVTIADMLLRAAARASNTRQTGTLTLQFSPSGQYFVAGYRGYLDANVIAYDVSRKAVINLRDQARRLLGGGFVFTSGDRLVGRNPQDLKKSGVIQLPGGQVQEIALQGTSLVRTTRPGHVLVSGVEKFPIALLDLATQQVVSGFTARTLDVFDDTYAGERGVGDVGLFSVEGAKLQKSVVLPAPLLSVRLGAVSPDLRWLTVSGSTRSAVWDTAKGDRLGYMQDYFGAFVEENGVIFADPATGNWRRTLMRFDVATRRQTPGARVEADHAAQYGRWLLLARPLEGNINSAGAAFQLRDVRRLDLATWSKEFSNDAPDDYWFDPESDALAFIWAADSPPGRIRIKDDEVLKKTVDMGDVKGDYVVELIDPATGNLRKRLLIETGKGSFRVENMLVRGGSMFVTDSIGRVLTYALDTGELRGYAFGEEPVATADGQALAVDSGIGRVVLYAAGTMARGNELRFKQPVVFKSFSADGSTLLAVTADQMMHLISVK